LRETPLPADLETPAERSLKREHAHLPLVTMLGFTQWSLGCFIVLLLLSLRTTRTSGSSSLLFAGLTVIGMSTVLAGIGASLLHLGRPLHAWKAFLGLQTSWLSREIVVFGGYMFASLAWTLWFLGSDLSGVPPAGNEVALAAVVTSGLAAVFCSIMVYVDTRRSFWRWSLTAPKFVGTALLLGFGTGFLLSERDATCTAGFIIVSVGKLAFEAGFLLVHTRNKDRSPDRRSALVMFRACGRTLAWRFIAGLIGGLVIPILALGAVASLNLKLAAFGLALFGEILERILFFEAVTPDRMPGIAQR